MSFVQTDHRRELRNGELKESKYKKQQTDS